MDCNSTNCSDTIDLTSSSWFWGSKICKFILAPPAIILNVLLILALRRCTSMHLHVNMKCLLINMSVCSLIASTYILVKTVYTFLIWAFDDPCKLETTFTNCKLQEAIFVFAKFPVLGSILGLGFERAYAIRHVNTYHNTKLPKLSIIVLVVIWTCSLGLTSVLLFTVDENCDRCCMPYCNALFIYNKNVIRSLSAILLPLELVGVAILIFIWLIMVRDFKPAFVNDIEYTLNGRFQKRLTIFLTRAMLPSSFLHAICWTLILGIAATQVTFTGLTMQQDLILSQYLFYVLLLVHMFLHPILCFVRCDFLWIELLKMCPCAQRYFPLPSASASIVDGISLIVDSTASNIEHFKMLNNMWDNEHTKNAQKKSRSQVFRDRSASKGLESSVEDCP